VASFILIPYFKTISIIYFKSELNGAAKTHPAKQTRALVSDFQEKTFLIHLFEQLQNRIIRWVLSSQFNCGT